MEAVVIASGEAAGADPPISLPALPKARPTSRKAKVARNVATDLGDVWDVPSVEGGTTLVEEGPSTKKRVTRAKAAPKPKKAPAKPRVTKRKVVEPPVDPEVEVDKASLPVELLAPTHAIEVKDDDQGPKPVEAGPRENSIQIERPTRSRVVAKVPKSTSDEFLLNDESRIKTAVGNGHVISVMHETGERSTEQQSDADDSVQITSEAASRGTKSMLSNHSTLVTWPQSTERTSVSSVPGAKLEIPHDSREGEYGETTTAPSKRVSRAPSAQSSTRTRAPKRLKVKEKAEQVAPKPPKKAPVKRKVAPQLGDLVFTFSRCEGIRRRKKKEPFQSTVLDAGRAKELVERKLPKVLVFGQHLHQTRSWDGSCQMDEDIPRAAPLMRAEGNALSLWNLASTNWDISAFPPAHLLLDCTFGLQNSQDAPSPSPGDPPTQQERKLAKETEGRILTIMAVYDSEARTKEKELEEEIARLKRTHSNWKRTHLANRNMEIEQVKKHAAKEAHRIRPPVGTTAVAVPSLRPEPIESSHLDTKPTESEQQPDVKKKSFATVLPEDDVGHPVGSNLELTVTDDLEEVAEPALASRVPEEEAAGEIMHNLEQSQAPPRAEAVAATPPPSSPTFTSTPVERGVSTSPELFEPPSRSRMNRKGSGHGQCSPIGSCPSPILTYALDEADHTPELPDDVYHTSLVSDDEAGGVLDHVAIPNIVPQKDLSVAKPSAPSSRVCLDSDDREILAVLQNHVSRITSQKDLKDAPSSPHSTRSNRPFSKASQVIVIDDSEDDGFETVMPDIGEPARSAYIERLPSSRFGVKDQTVFVVEDAEEPNPSPSFFDEDRGMIYYERSTHMEEQVFRSYSPEVEITAVTPPRAISTTRQEVVMADGASGLSVQKRQAPLLPAPMTASHTIAEPIASATGSMSGPSSIVNSAADNDSNESIDINERLYMFIRNQTQLYSRILRYEPLDFDALYTQITQCESLARCSRKALGAFLDSKAINYVLPTKPAKPGQNNRRRWK
ncbi:uncharacterized protein EV422DRAFT_309986 [Fimicolochytrium jonesii]|uniref:uncharacterized protein n=1 Tax=Fimicolochytrium jonesii TaxID=1396493 RepID=UPI0022FE302F|nr:uncharacterized protein EV422DRAFT_309986 [Fimicolochytrium jonesii]KAI8824169.1 hypothetical protein EV422DRAFT_309986 [Fimicolochytrium jonesii]